MQLEFHFHQEQEVKKQTHQNEDKILSSPLPTDLKWRQSMAFGCLVNNLDDKIKGFFIQGFLYKYLGPGMS
jgi:hypothetical protein